MNYLLSLEILAPRAIRPLFCLAFFAQRAGLPPQSRLEVLCPVEDTVVVAAKIAVHLPQLFLNRFDWFQPKNWIVKRVWNYSKSIGTLFVSFWSTPSVPTFQNIAKQGKRRVKITIYLLVGLWVWQRGSLMTYLLHLLPFSQLVAQSHLCNNCLVPCYACSRTKWRFSSHCPIQQVWNKIRKSEQITNNTAKRKILKTPTQKRRLSPPRERASWKESCISDGLDTYTRHHSSCPP